MSQINRNKNVSAKANYERVEFVDFILFRWLFLITRGRWVPSGSRSEYHVYDCLSYIMSGPHLLSSLKTPPDSHIAYLIARNPRIYYGE